MAEMTLPPRIQAFNATTRDYELSRSLAVLLMDSLQTHAQRPALLFEAQSLSYAELAQRAWALANHLRDAGLGAGDRVAICMPRSPELVIALLATLLSGAAYVPLDPDYPAARLAQMSEDAQASLLLGTADLSGDWLRDGTTLPILCVDATALAGQMAPPFACPAGPDDAAYMIFTSGSTGRPKGALNSHRGIVNRLCWMQEHYRLQPGECVLQKTPCSFDVSVWELFWPLLQGACIVLAKPGGHRDPRYLVDLIQKTKVDVVHFVPSMLAHFLEEPLAAQCTNLRQVICSGEALPAELVRRFFQTLPGVALDNLYGPTEAAVDVSCWPCRADAQESSVPIGFPIANTQLYVLDERGRALDVGEVGELYIGGVQVGMGYLGRDEETR
ncbi:MAG TPA: amino acid adenylation domain-containing protein, partial [Aquimonas sp.]|nr:amino acid adenylation domain-containing protein [Aquimonas sp.]